MKNERRFIGERNKSSTEYCSFGGFCKVGIAIFFFFFGIAILQKWVVLLSDLAHRDLHSCSQNCWVRNLGVSYSQNSREQGGQCMFREEKFTVLCILFLSLTLLIQAFSFFSWSVSPEVCQLKLTKHTDIWLWSLCCRCCQVTSVVSDSVRLHRRQPTRLPRPWDSPGRNTGVGCHFLLQCVKVKVKSLSHVRLLATPWTAAYQAPPSMDFPGKSTWVGCHCLLRSSL